MDKLTLANLKSKYGSIYALEVEGTLVYYRALNAWETQSFLDLKGDTTKDKLEVEHALCTFAIIHPSTLPEFKGPGSLSTLATEIWSKSVPSEESIGSVVDSVRDWAAISSKHNYAIMLAISLTRLMPSLDLVSLLDLPITKLLRIAALAEISTEVMFLKGEGGAKQGNASGGKVDMKENMTPDETADALASAIRAQREKK